MVGRAKVAFQKATHSEDRETDHGEDEWQRCRIQMDRECTECTERICCNLQLCELNADWLCSFG